jgi:hypothetical protein
LTPYDYERSGRYDFDDEWDDYDSDKVPYDEEEDYDMWDDEDAEEEDWIRIERH